MQPIFFLAGPPAVGKSTTAHALAGCFPKSVHIPVDDLRDMVVSGLRLPSADWSPELVEQLALARSSAAAMARSYNAAGFAVAIDDFWDPNSRLAEYAALFRKPNTVKVLLLPSQATAAERARERAGPGGDTSYLAGGIHLAYASLAGKAALLSRRGWLVLDTSALDVQATIQQILARAA